MTVQWGLGRAPDVGTNALAAFEHGQQIRNQREGNAALSAYAVNPNDQTLNALAPHAPGFVIGQKQAQAAAQAAKDKQAHAQLVQVSRLFDGVTDENSYQQRLQIAQRMGLPVNDAPPHFDPAWVQETGAIFKFFADKPEAMSTIGKQAVDEGYQPGTPEFNHRVVELGHIERLKVIPTQPGGGVVSYDPASGQSSVVVQPNDGSAPMGTPGVVTKNLGGKTYYQTPDGQWHDAPPGGQPGGAAPFSGKPVTNGVSVVKQLFPQARITSSFRPVGTKLAGGQTHDASWHTQSHAAVDVAPIKGMTFDQYVSKFRAAGYQIIEARDEATNPSKWSTGPHWHVVLGGQ